MTRYFVTIAALVAASGCARSPDSPLADVAKEPLRAGVGLGSLKLLQTTLGAFEREYGVSPAVVTTQESGAKVDFIKEGLTFLFKGDPACAQQLAPQVPAPGQPRRDLTQFFVDNPQCETMLLESIAAYIPAQGEPLYEGETLEGIGLAESRALAEHAYKRTQEAVTALETGTELPPEPPPSPDELRYPGIRVYMGRDAQGREVVRKIEVIPR